MLKCPKCAAALDVDEDEVEEGEIMSCAGCEVELEIVAKHPVQINVISSEEENEEEEKKGPEYELEESEPDEYQEEET